MAVNNNNGNNGPSSTMSDALKNAGINNDAPAQQEAPRPQQTQNRQAPQQSQGNRPPIQSLNQIMARPFNRNVSSEVVQGFRKAMQEQIENNLDESYRTNVSLVVLDNQSDDVLLSTIALSLSLQHEGKYYYLTHLYVVEGTLGGERMKSKEYSIGGQRIENEQVSGDVVNEQLWSTVVSRLTEQPGVKADVIFAGAQVLPNEMKADDNTAVHGVVFYGLTAIWAMLNTAVYKTEAPLSLAMVDRSTILSVNPQYHPAPVYDAAGLPIRSDVRVSVTASSQANGNYGLDATTEKDLTKVDAYVDMRWADPAPGSLPPPGAPGYSPLMATRRLVPELIITNVDTSMNAVTLEALVLAVYSATILRTGRAWAGVFLPTVNSTFNRGEKNTRDLGAIGYELDLAANPNGEFVPAKYDTNPENGFTAERLYQMVDLAFYDSMDIFIDVAEVGPLAWLHQTFFDAANGSREAYDALVKAADNLTDGNFSKLWQGGDIAVKTDNRLLGGYYYEGGVRRDVRDLDYLAVENLQGPRDPQFVQQWQDTFTNTNVPAPVRLERRTRFQKDLLNGPVYKVYYNRTKIMPQFLETVGQAIANMGAAIRPKEGPFTLAMGQAGRGAYDPSTSYQGGGLGAGFAYAPAQGNGWQGPGQSFLSTFGSNSGNRR